jgi:DNA-binding CsgD family transcriptional regulator/pimeloyl-ACP methyl ester carboxylesterase
MEPPPVRYVRTEDGFDIAYTVSGDGLPFVFMPWPFSHRGLWWQSVFGRPLSEALAQRFRLVMYDSRGQGMSTRGLPEDHCIDDYLTDLEAVVDRLGLERFVLMGCPLFGHVAVKYAVRRPERLVAIVVANIGPRSGAFLPRDLAEVARRNWDSFIFTIAAASSVAGAPMETSYWRAAIDREDFLLMEAAARASNIEDLLPQVTAPTFVGTNRFLRDGVTPNAVFPACQRIAALIPSARLDIAETDGEVLLPRGEEPPPLVTRLEAFLRDAGVLGDPAGSGRTGLEAQSGPAGLSAGRTAGLSSRQQEVLRLVAEGKTNREIAEDLVLSERTVQRHVADIYAKTGARNRAEATAIALGKAGPAS